jgi:ABC-type transport system substrate-binding protein
LVNRRLRSDRPPGFSACNEGWCKSGIPDIGEAAGEPPVRGGTLNWAYYPDPTSLIAINTSSGTGQAIGPKITEGLFDFDYDLNPIPLLATEWSVSGAGLRSCQIGRKTFFATRSYWNFVPRQLRPLNI